MRLALKTLAICSGYSILACLVLATAPSSTAFADGAFISQAVGSFKSPSVALPISPNSLTSPSGPAWMPHAGSTHATPELVAPQSGGNFASTLEIGSYNKVFQAQLGAGNISNVGIIGYANNVGVLQAGNHLTSNLALINTRGLSIGVIQPNGSAPINMLIARLPNGGLLIKR